MGWERVDTSATEQKTDTRRERIRGFMPFTPDSNVEGVLESIRINRDTNKGYYLIRATKSSTVNVQDADALTGQGKAQIGELIGIRKTGATKVLSRIPLGTLVSVTYIEMTEKESRNPKDGALVMCPFHNISIDVFKQAAASEAS